jgi:hypothetical protein
MKWLKILLLASTVFYWRSAVAQETLYYRYISDNGVTVISSRIPARYVPRGYDLITYDGKLVERISPELSPEKKSRLLKKMEKEARLEIWDKELLRRYSHPADIEAAKQRKLGQNNNDLGIMARNIEKNTEEINRYQSLAAAEERAGREVSADILNNIEVLKRERAAEMKKQKKKQQEQQKIIEKFDRNIERFKIIRPRTANYES